MEESIPDISNFTTYENSTLPSFTLNDITGVSITDHTSPNDLQNTLNDGPSSLKCIDKALGKCGGGSRSVKEFEEQMTSLKKENFNLKLRIYFLEEKLGVNFPLDEDNALKKNIELKVEIASLQKELQEKHELLVQAVKAMELEDDDHKKIVRTKDEVITTMQQELEDLRIQVNESKYDDGISHKSDPTGFYFSRAFPLQSTDSSSNVKDLQEKIQKLEEELNNEKENNASLQLLLDQTDSFKQRLESCQMELKEKDATIADLMSQLQSGDDKFKEQMKKIKELNQEIVDVHESNKELLREISDHKLVKNDMINQINELKKKCSTMKLDMEKERKKAERAKVMNDIKVSELEAETEKYKTKSRELVTKLEAAYEDVKKNQNLAVPSCQVQKRSDSHNDQNFSDSNATTSYRTPQKNALHVPLATPSPYKAPENIELERLEQLVLASGECQYPHEILSSIKVLKEERSAQQQKIIRLKAEQLKACEIIKSMIESRNKAAEEITQLKGHCQRLEQELESVVSRPDDKMSLHQKLSDMKIEAVSSGNNEKSMAEPTNEDYQLAEHYKAFSDELEIKIELLKATIVGKDAQLEKIRSQYEELIETLAEKENKIVDLEFEMLSGQNDSLKKCDSDEKDKEIERLKGELKKCNCYLQEIVNKELWEKNREIEKMHNKQGNTSQLLELKRDLHSKDSQLKLLKEKISELGLDISLTDLEDSNKIEEDNLEVLQIKLRNVTKLKEHLQSKIGKLKEKSGASFSDLEDTNIIFERLENLQITKQQKDVNYTSLLEEKAAVEEELSHIKKLYNESSEICTILSVRLEELAIFLDSLLKQKSVLGFLGIHKNKKLREIIDNSLDLSRSFTMSMMVNPEQSLTQLTNITALLNGSVLQDLSFLNQEQESVLSINPSQVTLTYQSHLYKPSQETGDNINHEQIINTLREQVTNLKYELQLRDTELNKLNNLIESSEKLTETDLGDLTKAKSTCSPPKSLDTSKTLVYQTDNQSESEAWSEPDRRVSRARIGLNTTVPFVGKCSEDSLSEASIPKRSSSTKNILDLHKQIANLEEELQRKIEEFSNFEASSIQLLQELNTKLNESLDKVAEAEENRREAESKVESLQNTIDTLTLVKNQMKESASIKDKDWQNKMNQIQIEKDAMEKSARKLEKELIEAKNEVTANKDELLKVTEECKLTKETVKKEYEEYSNEKIRAAEVEYTIKLETIQTNAKKEVMEVQNKITQLEELHKTEVDKKISEINQLSQEIVSLKESLKCKREEIVVLQTEETKLREKQQECQNLISVLRKELNTSTLKFSEVVLEKTSISNDKAQLEHELTMLKLKESDLKQELAEIQSELNQIKHSYNSKLSLLQGEKSKLEVKISELESTNAELHNRLIRLQTGSNLRHNVTLPNSLPNRSFDTNMVLYNRQFSDAHNYSSDDVDDGRHRNFSFGVCLPPVQGAEVDRLEANSSPDLGIESDQGRFSSLETHSNLPRPVLKTIELTESMNNLLDTENNPIDNMFCGNDNCCQTNMNLVKENNNLKKKLWRMKRTLEETAAQLSLTNQRKKQVEKNICRQIHKTSEVLRKAKANLDSGSESDVLKK